MYDYPDGPVSCNNDEGCTRQIYNWHDSGPLIVYVCWSVALVILVWWCLYRHQWRTEREELRLSRTISRPSRSAHGLADDTSLSKSMSSYGSFEEVKEEEQEGLQPAGPGQLLVEGYAESRLGEMSLVAIFGVSLGFGAIFITLVFDMYWDCQLTSIDAQCLYGSYPLTGTSHTNSNYFFVVWWLQVLWFTPLIWYKSKLRNWYTPTASDSLLIYTCLGQVSTTSTSLASHVGSRDNFCER